MAPRRPSTAPSLAGAIAIACGIALAATPPPTAGSTILLVAVAAPRHPAPTSHVGAPPEPTGVDFTRDVRPILSEHCFACHGPDKAARKAQLSLVSFKDATDTLRSGSTPIVPGDLETSELWRRINDADDPMPPTEAHNPLAPEEIAILGRWIQEGGAYAPHWAYVQPKATPTPTIEDVAWPRDDVDRFILARLQDRGLPHAPDADPATLLRRLSYDLTGLPPDAASVTTLIDDASPETYTATVDRLLASEHFGERMAMMWLDLVRFADTVGYHGDQGHHIWPYRDWVINAFNDNMPFDQFTTEQLAGDLLTEPTQQQRIATGYTRLNQTTHEGGAQLKEYRAIYMADRVRNLSVVWMGATVGCAQCHDHKYDPYTARDFHTLGAFFADIDDEEHLRNQYGGLNTVITRRLPHLHVTTPLSEAHEAEIAARLEDADEELHAALATADAAQHQWEIDLLSQVDTRSDRVWVDDERTPDGRVQGEWNFTVVDGVAPISGAVYRVQQSDGLIQHYTADTTVSSIHIEEGDGFRAWIYLDESDPPSAIMVQFNTGGDDWSHRAVWGSDEIPYGRRKETWPGYHRMGPLPALGEWVELAIPASLVGVSPGAIVSGIAFTQFGGTVLWDKVSSESSLVPLDVIAALTITPQKRTPQQKTMLRDRHRDANEIVRSRRGTIAGLDAERKALQESLPLTMVAASMETPRDVRILPRGNWLDESGPLVEPAIPAFLGNLETGGRATRLDLARWLVSPAVDGGAGELTARVLVNRIWAMLLGQGLCPSLDDFGGQGQPPTHLELLDHLTLDFVASGWDVKLLIRRLVHTRTYRQSSIPSQAIVAADPDNFLFGRQSRYRLPAEMVRDTSLAVSGLLVQTIGGPSVKPAQPEAYYQHLNFPARKYLSDTDDQQWRRGLYMHWQRQFLHPMLRAFDAPSRQECAARRPISNTPLAALAMMNDPNAMDAARSLAHRILTASLDDDRDRAATLMQWTTSRLPQIAEIDVLLSLFDRSMEYYNDDPSQANAVVTGGRVDPDPALDPVVLAAWTDVARTVLNLHETLTRE